MSIYYGTAPRPAVVPGGGLPALPRPCRYRRCRQPFTPPSDKRGQQYCCDEHREAESAARKVKHGR